MNEKDFLKKIHRRLAQITVGSSAIRNQGIAGLVEISRNYLENDIKVKEFFPCLGSEKRFKNYINLHTEKLLEKYPQAGKSWGAARKSLNLFFRELVYNKFLAEQFRLPIDFDEFNEAVQILEVPLDSNVANGIITNSNTKVPKWKSIKGLTQEASDKYQDAAKDIAALKGIARVHLDLIFWRPSNS